MHCSGCKGTVHWTTELCPHCGGDFNKLFGPTRRWGKPSNAQTFKTQTFREAQIEAEAERRTQEIMKNSSLPSPSKVLQWVFGIAVVYYIVMPVISWLF